MEPSLPQADTPMEPQTRPGPAVAATAEAPWHASEQALIGRIADVDDDRRRTATALQRAFETHAEEMAAKLHRSRQVSMSVAVLALLLAVAAFWLGLRQPALDPTLIGDEVTRLRQEVAGLLAFHDEEERLHDQLLRLTAMVSQLSASLGLLEIERAERREADADLSARLEKLAAEIAAGNDPGDRAASAPGEETQGTVDPPASLAAAAEPLSAALEPVAPERSETPAAPERSEAPEENAPPLFSGPPSAPEAETDAEEEPGGTADAFSPPPIPAEDEADEPAPVAAPAWQTADPTAPEAPGRMLESPGYALQLIGLYDFDRLRAFADREDLPRPLYYRTERLRGQPWYVLIHSLHADRASAEQARSALPADLATLDLWIRPLASGTRLEILFPAGTP